MRVWRQFGFDWYYDFQGVRYSLSFDPEAIDYNKIGTGDWEGERDKSDKFMALEGSKYPYGYIPLYRDRLTQCLVMQRNRSLTTEKEEEARKSSMSETDILIRKVHMRVAASEGDYE